MRDETFAGRSDKNLVGQSSRVAAEAVGSQPKVMANGGRPISGRKQMLRLGRVKL
jgi:hypothetical protein